MRLEELLDRGQTWYDESETQTWDVNRVFLTRSTVYRQTPRLPAPNPVLCQNMKSKGLLFSDSVAKLKVLSLGHFPFSFVIKPIIRHISRTNGLERYVSHNDKPWHKKYRQSWTAAETRECTDQERKTSGEYATGSRHSLPSRFSSHIQENTNEIV